MAKESNLLTVPQAAELLGLSDVRVRQFCQQGRLGKKIGPLYLISQRELRAFSDKPRLTGRPGHRKSGKQV